MAAKDYKICCALFNAYIAKVSKRNPNLMLEDRRKITESEILGLIDWYLDNRLDENNDVVYFDSQEREGFEVHISYVKKINKEVMTREEQIEITSLAYGCVGSGIDFEAGAKWADANPKSPWISVEKDLPCNHEDMVKVSIEGVELNTDRVLVTLDDGTTDISYMFKPIPHSWRWNEVLTITHWMPIPKLEEE